MLGRSNFDIPTEYMYCNRHIETQGLTFSRCYNSRAGWDRSLSVSVEVYLGAGLPSFNIVGLPETSVKEAKDRVPQCH